MSKDIVYLDDEAHNLTVFEASSPEEWNVHIFDDPLQAIQRLKETNPQIIVSDQRMPGMSGVEFLEVAKQICPKALRIIVTGYSDEDLIIQSVRQAQVFDYIRKPWNFDDVVNSIERGFQLIAVEEEKQALLESLEKQTAELEQQNKQLLATKVELENASGRELEIRKEMECWIPPFIMRSLQKGKEEWPIVRDLVGVTFDIVNSGPTHEKSIGGVPLRNAVIKLFTEISLRHGGWREAHFGDSAYAHFGLMDSDMRNACISALAVASEFRMGLRNLSKKYDVEIECGIAVHYIEGAKVNLHKVEMSTPHGTFIQKSFDTSSPQIDLLFRLEKEGHRIPGSNILMSGEFVEKLGEKPDKVSFVGGKKFKNMTEETKIYIQKSDLVSDEELEGFKAKVSRSDIKQAA